MVLPGAVLTTVGLWSFTLTGAGSPLITVIGAHVLMMAGLGLMLTPLMTEPLAVLPGRLYAHGTAILNCLQQLGGAMGVAVLVSVAALGTGDPAAAPDELGTRLAFAAAGAVGVLAVVGSLFLRRPTVSSP